MFSRALLRSFLPVALWCFLASPTFSQDSDYYKPNIILNDSLEFDEEGSIRMIHRPYASEMPLSKLLIIDTAYYKAFINSFISFNKSTDTSIKSLRYVIYNDKDADDTLVVRSSNISPLYVLNKNNISTAIKIDNFNDSYHDHYVYFKPKDTLILFVGAKSKYIINPIHSISNYRNKILEDDYYAAGFEFIVLGCVLVMVTIMIVNNIASFSTSSSLQIVYLITYLILLLSNNKYINKDIRLFFNNFIQHKIEFCWALSAVCYTAWMRNELRNSKLKYHTNFNSIFNIILILGIIGAINEIIIAIFKFDLNGVYFSLVIIFPQLFSLIVCFLAFVLLFIVEYANIKENIVIFIILFFANFSFFPSVIITSVFNMLSMSSQNLTPLMVLLGCTSAFVMSWQQANKLKRTTRDKIEAQQETLRVIEEQKDVLERTVDARTADLRLANARITDSIQYASRIQGALLPDLAALQSADVAAALHYHPRDVVGGDFYWFARQGYQVVIAVADCTGHGVPGAFMSVLGTSLLKQLVVDRGMTQPAEILTRLDAEMRQALKQDGLDLTALDGMDIGILTLVPDLGQGLYAGANRPLLLQRGSEWVEFKGTRRHVGGRQVSDIPYGTEALQLLPDDRLYLLTDGITDQLGGPESAGPGRKWGWARLKEQLAQQPLPSDDPAQSAANLAALQEALRSWQGSRPQLDDQLLLGLRL